MEISLVCNEAETRIRFVRSVGDIMIELKQIDRFIHRDSKMWRKSNLLAATKLPSITSTYQDLKWHQMDLITENRSSIDL